MSWLWLALCCLAGSLVVHGLVRRLWIAVPLASLLGPILFLAAAALVTGQVEALAAVVLVVGQVVAIPVAVAVGAGFHSLRGGDD